MQCFLFWVFGVMLYNNDKKVVWEMYFFRLSKKRKNIKFYFKSLSGITSKLWSDQMKNIGKYLKAITNIQGKNGWKREAYIFNKNRRCQKQTRHVCPQKSKNCKFIFSVIFLFGLIDWLCKLNYRQKCTCHYINLALGYVKLSSEDYSFV